MYSSHYFGYSSSRITIFVCKYLALDTVLFFFSFRVYHRQIFIICVYFRDSTYFISDIHISVFVVSLLVHSHKCGPRRCNDRISMGLFDVIYRFQS